MSAHFRFSLAVLLFDSSYYINWDVMGCYGCTCVHSVVSALQILLMMMMVVVVVVVVVVITHIFGR